MQLVCLSFHHIKTSYGNFQKVRFEDPGQFYVLTSGERVLLQTGTRVEVYAYVDDVDSLFDIFVSKSGMGGVEIKEFFDVYVERDAALHLFRMTGCIESRVLGETYIPLVVESAFQLARGKGGVGPRMEAVFDAAIRIWERARRETEIEGSGPIVDIASKLILEDAGELENKSVVLLGAGTTGRKLAEGLSNRGAKISIVNRNQDIGYLTAQKVGGTLLSYAQLSQAISDADVLICATLASHYRVLPETIEKRNSPLVIVDVSPFGNVSPEVVSKEGVVLTNGELEKAVKKNHETARAEVPMVEQIIEEEMAKLKIGF